jgi:hypothetical protein
MRLRLSNAFPEAADLLLQMEVEFAQGAAPQDLLNRFLQPMVAGFVLHEHHRAAAERPAELRLLVEILVSDEQSPERLLCSQCCSDPGKFAISEFGFHAPRPCKLGAKSG